MSRDGGKPRVGIFGLTGCAGDQLQILNCEDHLLVLVVAQEILRSAEQRRAGRETPETTPFGGRTR
ncbi:MAG TPA: hypothetical protein VLT81_09875 [Chondromyces sp.]|nr:hypothetical protein [Chondromyces sp.]